MNESQIRKSVHQKLLRRYHNVSETLVVDELGLKHGLCRADIAVINGRLMGYEIKSDSDTLIRLKRQISLYDAVFDTVSVVVGSRHGSTICRRVPCHWGVIIATAGHRGTITFRIKRKSRLNPRVDLLSVAQLLWRAEAVQIIQRSNPQFGGAGLVRNALYQYLVDSLSPDALRHEVRSCLRNRLNWRYQTRSSPSDDSSQRDATSLDRPVRRGDAHTFECNRPRRKISHPRTIPILVNRHNA